LLKPVLNSPKTGFKAFPSSIIEERVKFKLALKFYSNK
jgi:hypothetical protein